MKKENNFTNLKEKNCVFFSTVYPYETTLKNELPFMSQVFNTVFYLPSSVLPSNIELPENVSFSPIIADSFNSWKKFKFILWFKAFKIFLTSALMRGNLKPYFKHLKQYFSISLRNVYWAEELKLFISKNNLEDAIYYDYWFENTTLALAILKKEGLIKNLVTRSHGFDLYNERWLIGKVPYREYKIKYIDKVFTVAKHGQIYFKEQVDNNYHSKILLNYLGINNFNIKPNRLQKTDEILLVSASNTRDFKRVHLIPELLSCFTRKIRWVHFGDGPMDKVLKINSQKVSSNITIEIKGKKSNVEVLDFLQSQPVNFFISLSTSEGLPISMMESISYGIPIFACNVCGIPDLINPETGFLFEVNDSIKKIQEKLIIALDKNYDSKIINKYAVEKFDCFKNYIYFYSEINDMS